MSNKPIDVLSYRRLEDFLVDFYNARKRLSPQWSLGVWSSKLGLSSRAMLSMIMKGERSPSHELTEKFVSYFQFDEKQKQHFFDLVALQKFNAKKQSKDRILNYINRAEPRYSVVLTEEVFSRICHWYCFALREITFLKDFKSSVDWIRNKFYFPPDKKILEESVNELLALELLTKEDDEIQSSRLSITTTDEKPSMALRNYHIENVDLIKHAIQEIPIEKRYFSSGVLTIRKDRLEEAKKLIRSFEENFYLLLEEKPGDMVVTLNIQMFPLTKDEE